MSVSESWARMIGLLVTDDPDDDPANGEDEPSCPETLRDPDASQQLASLEEQRLEAQAELGAEDRQDEWFEDYDYSDINDEEF